MALSDIIDSQIYIKRGSVYHWIDYKFSTTDERKDKYWITLNCLINDFPINVILPTSQVENKFYSKKDNQIDTVTFEANESIHFNKKTILDLKNIIEEEETTIREASETNYLTFKGELESHLFERIEEGIRQAVTISPILKEIYLCQD